MLEAPNHAQGSLPGDADHELRTTLTVLALAVFAGEARNLPAGVHEDVENDPPQLGAGSDVDAVICSTLRAFRGGSAVQPRAGGRARLLSRVGSGRPDGQPAVEVAGDGGRRHFVRGDAAAAEHGLLELIKNSVKFHPPGGRSVTPPFAARHWRGEVVTGDCITAELLPRIFHALSRGSIGHAQFGGLVWNLAISRPGRGHGGAISA